MTSVNVTCLVTDLDPAELSGSVAERGPNAGPETWTNALDASDALTIEDPAAVRDFFADFGAWDDEEIAAWTPAELAALVLQYAAGDLREVQSLCPGDGLGDVDWTEAEAMASAGNVGGRLWAADGELWINLSE